MHGAVLKLFMDVVQMSALDEEDLAARSSPMFDQDPFGAVS